MRTPLAWVGLVLCAMPLLAQKAERHVVAPCELTTASVTASGKESETEGREFTVRVINNSKRTIALPASPIFGWRVEILKNREWRLKAEGGPVRRVTQKDEHIVVIGHPATTPLRQIPPASSEDFYVFLPEAEKALRPEAPFSTLKLTIYWAAPVESPQSSRDIPLCGLAPVWVVTAQTPTPSK